MYIDLNAAEVHRSGVTATTWNFETRNCKFKVANERLSFKLIIASKGGGFTEVLLSIGEEDIPVILEKLLLEMPNFEVQMLDTQRKATELRHLKHDEQTRTLGALLDRLEKASDSSRELESKLQLSYWLAPDDDDEAEKTRYEKATEVEEAIADIRAGLADLLDEFAEGE